MRSTESHRAGYSTKVIGSLFAIVTATGLVAACGERVELAADRAAPRVVGLPVDYAAADVRPGQRQAPSVGLPVDYAAPDVRPGQRQAPAPASGGHSFVFRS